jgi:hypothetical protein
MTPPGSAILLTNVAASEQVREFHPLSLRAPDDPDRFYMTEIASDAGFEDITFCKPVTETNFPAVFDRRVTSTEWEYRGPAHVAYGSTHAGALIESRRY